MQDGSAESVLLAGKLIRRLRRVTTLPIFLPHARDQVAALVQAGHVSKEPHPASEVAVFTGLTEKGNS